MKKKKWLVFTDATQIGIVVEAVNYLFIEGRIVFYNEDNVEIATVIGPCVVKPFEVYHTTIHTSAGPVQVKP